jgi:hypothetical protein
MIIIGISGVSRSGKDTLANQIIKTCRDLDPQFRVVKRSFAWPLKKIAQSLYGYAGVEGPEYYDKYPDERYKRTLIGKTPVELWIELGEKVRTIHGQTWIDLMWESAEGHDAVIVPDCRHLNEYDALREEGAIMIRTNREDGLVLAMDSNLDGIQEWDHIAGPTLEDVIKLGKRIGMEMVSGVLV